MRVNRTRHERAYVQIPNAIARHGNLSLEAVGLLVRLLFLPDGSGATVEKIASQVSNGRRAVSRAMNELIKAGYVRRAKVQDPETGRWVTLTTVTDTPENSASPTDRMPTVGAPTLGPSGAIPNGIKTESKKDTTTPREPAEDEHQDQPGEAEQGREGKSTLLAKIDREMRREARRILERLSLHKALPLADQDIERLAPKMLPWLREDISRDEILRCLASGLPDVVDSVPGLITYRLSNFTPERIAAPTVKPAVPAIPKVECAVETCRRPIKGGTEGDICRDCRDELDGATAFLTGNAPF